VETPGQCSSTVMPTSEATIIHQEILMCTAAETQKGRDVTTGAHLRGSNLVDSDPLRKVHVSRNGQMVYRADSGHGAESAVESSRSLYSHPDQQKRDETRIQSPICHQPSRSTPMETSTPANTEIWTLVDPKQSPEKLIEDLWKNVPVRIMLCDRPEFNQPSESVQPASDREVSRPTESRRAKPDFANQRSSC